MSSGLVDALTGGDAMNSIDAQNLSKRYRILKKRSTSLKEMVIHEWFRPAPSEEVWALRDVTFSMPEGGTLGIIGANGSGKSTLLKLISGITQPTTGSISIRGRVASLLELGAGFHPDLTGMENIYLNASVLGLPKAKIDAAVEEIIAFAGLERFIHMPVRHYSSGMLMRLGFSVAVQVDPDILLLDEVMAVGDAEFQAKSAGKIFEFKKRGKTILLVTHNLEQAKAVSERILWLERGRVKFFGSPEDAVKDYIREFYDQLLKEPPMPFNLEFGSVCLSARMGSGEVMINRVVMRDGAGRETWTVHTGETLKVELHYSAKRQGLALEAVMGISRDNVGVMLVDSASQAFILQECPQRGVITAIFSPLLLCGGAYRLSVALNPPGKPFEPYDIHLRFYELHVVGGEEGRIEPIIAHPAAFEVKKEE